MEQIIIEAKQRQLKPKGLCKRIRSRGLIPAIYYGQGEKNIPLEVSAKEIGRILRHKLEKHIIDLKIDNADDVDSKAIIKDLQKDVLSQDVTHIDFLHISMDKEITTEVTIEFTGESVGVKNSDGFMQTVLRSVQVTCLPADLPEKVTVDISNLDIGHSLHVSDLKIPNATILNDPEETIALVTVVKEQATSEEQPGEESSEEPKIVDAKGKKEEDEKSEGKSKEKGK